MQHAVKSIFHRRRAVWAAATALVVAGGAGAYVAMPASAGPPSTFADQTYPATLAAPSADKAQSKVWRGDNGWWAVMISATKGVPTIHELRTNHTWRDTGTVVDTRADSTADVWYASSSLYVVSRNATGSLLYSRFTYTSATRSFTKVAGFPKTIDTGGFESAALAKDSTGTIWVTYTKDATATTRTVMYAKSAGTNDATWTKAALPVADKTVSADDISAIVAYKGHVGIGWSDQQSEAFRFASHTDGAAAGSWTVQDMPVSGPGMVDDHINLKAVGGDARVFAVVKTSKDQTGGAATDPLIYVLRRNADGTWVKAKGASVADKATRPQLLLDRENSRVYLFETSPPTGNIIYYKSSPFVGLKFSRGRGAPLTAAVGATINDVSTAKGSTNNAAGAVAISVDTTNSRYYHSELSIAAADTQNPISDVQINATLSNPGEVTATWPLATDDRGIVAYDVWVVDVTAGTTTKQTPITIDTSNQENRTYTFTKGGLTAGHDYRIAVQARDAAGNVAVKRTTSVVTV